MAMFTLIEINGDHLADLTDNMELEHAQLGNILRGIVENTFNAERLLEANGLYRVIRVVKQSGERTSFVELNKPYPNYSPDTDLSLRKPYATMPEVVAVANHQAEHQRVTDGQFDKRLRDLEQRMEDVEDEVSDLNSEHTHTVARVNESVKRDGAHDALISNLAARIAVLEKWRLS